MIVRRMGLQEGPKLLFQHYTNGRPMRFSATLNVRIAPLEDEMIETSHFESEPTAKLLGLEETIKRALEIKASYVDPKVKWYKKHRRAPFVWFRCTGVLVIIFSTSLPAVSTVGWGKYDVMKPLCVATMSVAIAALATLSSFYKWERTWRSRTTTYFSMEAFCAKWELEVEKARSLATIADQVQHVYLATNDLLTNIQNIGSAETAEFFAGTQFPQSNEAGQNPKVPPPVR